jgi:hypothetical protein
MVTSNLLVMSSKPKIGALDRQAGSPRVALQYSNTRNPAIIGSFMQHTEIQLSKRRDFVERGVANSSNEKAFQVDVVDILLSESHQWFVR